MKLRITFSGMELFVPQPATATDPATMHVVMPTLAGHHGDARHLPMLVFDAAHLFPGNQLATDELVFRYLKDTVLTIGANSADLFLCPEIVNLRAVTSVGIDTQVLNTDPNTVAVARTALRDGKMTRVAPGACWEWEYRKPRPLAHVAEWVIDGLDPTQPPPLTLVGWHGKTTSPLPRLYPLGNEPDAVIDLLVLHVPPADLPPDPEVQHEKPNKGYEPPHFGAYYGLYGKRVPEWRPRFHNDYAACQSVISNPCPHMTFMAASPYNCMLAGDG